VTPLESKLLQRALALGHAYSSPPTHPLTLCGGAGTALVSRLNGMANRVAIRRFDQIRWESPFSRLAIVATTNRRRP